MSIFDKMKHSIQQAFHPVEQMAQDVGHQFDSHHVAEVLTSAIADPIKAKLPGHLSLGEAAKVIEIAQPDAIDVDVFVGFGLELGIELELEFDLGVTWENPVDKVEAIVGLVENPPETVHQLCDRLWSVVPSEVRVYERLQAVVGEQVQVRWYGPDVMERLTAYIGYRGWLDKRLRP